MQSALDGDASTTSDNQDSISDIVHDSENTAGGLYPGGPEHCRYMGYRVLRNKDVICRALCCHKVARIKGRNEDRTRYELVLQFHALPKCWNGAWTKELMESTCREVAQEVKGMAELLRQRSGIPVIRTESVE